MQTNITDITKTVYAYKWWVLSALVASTMSDMMMNGIKAIVINAVVLLAGIIIGRMHPFEDENKIESQTTQLDDRTGYYEALSHSLDKPGSHQPHILGLPKTGRTARRPR